jgi:AcrR family transcriptional regulator
MSSAQHVVEAAPNQRVLFGEVSYTAAQLRVIDAALQLMAELGVNGTSLQMIANAMGVTKAAVYHQFKTKDEIVIAVADHNLVTLQATLDEAEALPDRSEARLFLLRRIIEYSVSSRALIRVWQSDPEMERVLAEFPPYMNLMTRMYDLLVEGPEHKVMAAMLSAAITAVGYPALADVEDERLIDKVLFYARRMLDLPA